MFDDYKVTNNAIELLVKRLGNNLDILYQEIEKLKIYDKIIVEEDILSLTVETINIDVFKFADDIINKNKEIAIKTYKELLKLNEEPISVIALIASKFRLIYQTNILTSKGYIEEDISNILKVHKYPVHLVLYLVIT